MAAGGPVSIPAHLQHLRTWRGLPVPYINCWTPELDEYAWTIRPDPTVNMQPAFFTSDGAGVGEPDFTKQCLQRQRECAVHGLCQVCRRKISRGRYLVLTDISVDVVEIDDVGTCPVVTEPWLCRRCLPYVLRACPGLRRRSDNLHAVLVTRFELVVSRGWHDSYGRDVSAAMWVKIAVVDSSPVEMTEIIHG